MKRLLGIIFLLIASFLTLAFLFQIPKTIGAVIRISPGRTDFTYLIVIIFTWMLQVGVIYVLFRYGLKWTRTKSHPSMHNTNALDETLIRNERIK